MTTDKLTELRKKLREHESKQHVPIPYLNYLLKILPMPEYVTLVDPEKLWEWDMCDSRHTYWKDTPGQGAEATVLHIASVFFDEGCLDCDSDELLHVRIPLNNPQYQEKYLAWLKELHESAEGPLLVAGLCNMQEEYDEYRNYHRLSYYRFL